MADKQADDGLPWQGSLGPTNPVNGLPLVEKEKKKVQRQIGSFGRKLRKKHTPPPPVDAQSVHEWSQRMHDAKLQAQALFNAWCEGPEEFEQALNNPELDAPAIYQLVGLALSTPDPDQAAKAARAKNAGHREAARKAWQARKIEDPTLSKLVFAEEWQGKHPLPKIEVETVARWLVGL